MLNMETKTLNSKWVLAIIIFLITLILRAPAFWTPILDVDEAQFAGYADALLSGGLPYVSSVDTKPLGIYYFFAAIFALFGRNNMLAVHLATAVVVAITALYCYYIAKKLFSERAGIFAAFFYAVFSTTYIPKFISTSIVVVMMLPLTMAVYYLISWNRDKAWWRPLLAGALLALSFLFKYQAGITYALAGFYLLFFSKIYDRKTFYLANIKCFIIFLAGSFLIGLLFILHLYHLGVLNEFYFWSLRGSFSYIEAGRSTVDFLKTFLIRGGSFVASTFLIWFFGLRYMSKLIWSKHPVEQYWVLFWFLFNLIPVCMGGRFFGHYFIQLLPPLVILAAADADLFVIWLQNNEIKFRQKLAYTLFVIGIFLPAVGFFGARLAADQIYAAIGEENPKHYQQIAQYIKDNTKPDDTIFVWGFATPIYFYSDRYAASRFLWCDWLTGRVSGSPTAKDVNFDTSQFVTPGSWQKFFEDLEKNKPAYFIDTSPGNYHDYIKYPVAKYPQLKDYLTDNYYIEREDLGIAFYKRKNNS
ncbi:MAG: glycosyltransferase family 39 protein [Pseudomonadota bacterium]